MLTVEEKNYIRNVVSKFKHRYLESDTNHGLRHVLHVTAKALKMNKVLALNIDHREIILAGICHDLFAREYRAEHHELGRAYILTENHDCYINDRSAMIRVSEAIAEHRASYTGKYYSKLSELISAADRDEPNLKKLVARCYDCATDPVLLFEIDKGKPIPDIEIYKSVRLPELAQRVKDGGYDYSIYKTYVHILEKYSRYGYARRNDIFDSYYADKLESFYKQLEVLTPETIISIVNKEKV